MSTITQAPNRVAFTPSHEMDDLVAAELTKALSHLGNLRAHQIARRIMVAIEQSVMTERS